MASTPSRKASKNMSTAHDGARIYNRDKNMAFNMRVFLYIMGNARSRNEPTYVVRVTKSCLNQQTFYTLFFYCTKRQVDIYPPSVC